MYRFLVFDKTPCSHGCGAGHLLRTELGLATLTEDLTDTPSLQVVKVGLVEDSPSTAGKPELPCF